MYEVTSILSLALVVQRPDKAIQWISVDKTNHAIHWIVSYLVDSIIHLSNNPSLVVSSDHLASH